MKLHFLLGSLLMMSSFSTYAQYNSKAEKIKYALKITKELDPISYDVLKRDKDQMFPVFLTGNTEGQMNAAMGTAVHETVHMLDFKLCTNSFSNHAYYLGLNQIVEIPMVSGIFDTQEINKIVNPEIRKRMHRYETYVGDNASNDMDSRQNGIYGLFEEFNAYYHGARMSYAQAKKGMNMSMFAGSSGGGTVDTMEAYYEFNFFIASYLLYAKKYHPALYKKLITNSDVKRVYNTINDNFAKLIKEVKKNGFEGGATPSFTDFSFDDFESMDDLKSDGTKEVIKNDDGSITIKYKTENMTPEEMAKILENNGVGSKAKENKGEKKSIYFSLALADIIGPKEKAMLELLRN